MKSQEPESIKKLLRRFLGPVEANEAAEDIRVGEQILNGHATPEPVGEVIAQIKLRIGERLRDRRINRFKRAVYGSAAVAAVFILVAVGSLYVVNSKNSASTIQNAANNAIIPTAIWESDRIADDDAELAVLTAEVKQIEGSVLALEFEENGSTEYQDLTNIEEELLEIKSNFWKG